MPDAAPLTRSPMDPPAPLILLDDARAGHERVLRFCSPLKIVAARELAEVAPALESIETALQAGRFAAGYFSYELGYLLEPRLCALLPNPRAMPLLWFGIFENAEFLEKAAAETLFSVADGGRAYTGPLRHEWDRAAYKQRFALVHDWTAAGDIYQANLSFRSRFRLAGDPFALYAALRRQSRMAYGAYLDDGTRQILSLSPELFFTLDADGRLTAKPMKGTAARAAEPSADAASRARLASSVKERAENLMIVDLLRNDLGRVAETGSVTVENLFAVETYPTLHTLVSTVAAQKKPPVAVTEIVRALFPCGSVTGAPKIRAMEIIRALEESSRGVYCGAIGYFAPDGSAKFNVAIRTLTISGDRGELGIGGAVTYDSRADAEYEECLLKARYYENARRPLTLIETLRWEPGQGFVRLPRHLARMQASAAFFDIAFDGDGALRTLERAASGAGQGLRVRLTLDEAGVFGRSATPWGAQPPFWRFAISSERVRSTDLFLRHKTDWRDLYEEEYARAGRDLHCDEVLFLNERGELAEGSRSNIFVEREGMLLTPPLSAGCLNGCLRQELLEQGRCTEAVLTPVDLESAEAIYCGNSLRGLVRAVPV